MHERAMREAAQRNEATREYIRQAAASDTTSTSDEIAKPARLRDEGTLTEEELQARKAKLLT